MEDDVAVRLRQATVSTADCLEAAEEIEQLRVANHELLLDRIRGVFSVQNYGE